MLTDGLRLDRIVRYPIKGFAGVDSGWASVSRGHGIRWDRHLAITSGRLEDVAETGWNPREAYLHLARDEYLALFEVTMEAPESMRPTVRLRHPDGWSECVVLSSGGVENADELDERLINRFRSGGIGGARLSSTGTPLWDWEDAHLSIINLATVRALSEAAGREVAPERFRANLYIDGTEPWAEFGWLGHTLRIGDARLEVVQPTDRCRATTIDPRQAISNINVPGLLASQFGHMFCGVYARVIESGVLKEGASIAVDAGRVVGESAWPRASRVLSRVEESETMTSLWINDPLSALASALPGQHVRVHPRSAATPAWRCYTLSARDGDRFRISVKRDGRVSSALHALAAGDEIVVTGPFGHVTLDDSTEDILLLSAGAGITPTVAMVRALADGPDRRRVRVAHVERTASPSALWDEIVSACDRLDDARAIRFLTRGSDDDEGADVFPGRPTTHALAELLTGIDLNAVRVYACGPGDFVADMRALVVPLGITADRVHGEVFFSPAAAALTAARSPSTTGPHQVSAPDGEAMWTPSDRTLLETVERIRPDWPSGCRSGACGACVSGLIDGEVEYLSEALYPLRDGEVLVCCAAPVSDVVITPYAGTGGTS